MNGLLRHSLGYTEVMGLRVSLLSVAFTVQMNCRVEGMPDDSAKAIFHHLVKRSEVLVAHSVASDTIRDDSLDASSHVLIFGAFKVSQDHLYNEKELLAFSQPPPRF
jgi:hypothetical protein